MKSHFFDPSGEATLSFSTLFSSFSPSFLSLFFVYVLFVFCTVVFSHVLFSRFFCISPFLSTQFFNLTKQHLWVLVICGCGGSRPLLRDPPSPNRPTFPVFFPFLQSPNAQFGSMARPAATIPRLDPQERKKKRKCGGRGKKARNFWPLHLTGPLLGSHPSCHHPSDS